MYHAGGIMDFKSIQAPERNETYTIVKDIHFGDILHKLDITPNPEGLITSNEMYAVTTYLLNNGYIRPRALQ